MVRIISTVPEFVRLRDVTPGEARVKAWRDQYEAAHRSAFQVYYRAWGDPKRRAESAVEFDHLVPLVQDREVRAKALIDHAAQQLDILGLAGDRPWHAVLLVGVGSSNGWVATLDGFRTLFLALELLPEPPFDAVLVAHEALHAVQEGEVWDETVGANLWREGAAAALSRRVRPGISDSGYLWFDESHSDWVEACAIRRVELIEHVRTNLHNGDAAVIRDIFSMPQGSTIPHRCGYWVGDQLITTLLDQGCEPRELLSAPYGSAMRFAAQGLDELIARVP